MTARDAWAQVAHDLRALAESIDRAVEFGREEQPAPPRPVAAAGGPPAPAVDTSACPKHGVPFEQGQYGPYCKQMTDDPAWGKAKTDRDGNPVLWCKITPKNAPDWLRIQGA